METDTKGRPVVSGKTRPQWEARLKAYGPNSPELARRWRLHCPVKAMQYDDDRTPGPLEMIGDILNAMFKSE